MVKQSNPLASQSLRLSDEERSALIWALELARALLLGDPDIRVLLTDPTVSPEVLDELADCLVLAGQPAAGSDS